MNDNKTEITNDVLHHYRQEYSISKKNLPEGTASDLKHIRDDAMEFFLARGFPSAKEEEWRFTNIQLLARTKFTMSPDSHSTENAGQLLERSTINIPEARTILFINGRYIPHKSDGIEKNRDITFRSIRHAISEDHPVFKQHFTRMTGKPSGTIAALNTGLFADGIFLHIPDDTAVPEPFYFIFITKNDGINSGTYPRNLIVTGRNSKVSIIEHYCSADKSAHLTNAVTELYADAHSIVEHTKLQLENTNAFHFHSLHADQRTGSRLFQNSVMVGGSIARNEIIARLDEEGAECTLNGLSLTAGKQLIDNHTAIDHSKPHCESHQLYKAILDGSSKGVFNGKIYVRKDAQKTDAKQTNKTLLLSDDATMNTKPQLEIFADDVKCTHGATIGYLDAEAIFYLRSRGISEVIARDLLTYAFANDIISKISNAHVREYLNHLIYTRLKQGRELKNI